MSEVGSDMGRRWGLGEATAGLLAALLLSSLGVSLAAGSSETVPLGAIAVGQVGLWVGLAGAPLWAARRSRSTLRHEFGLEVRKGDWLFLVVGVASQLILLPVLYWLIQLLTGPLDVAAPARKLADRAGSDAAFVLLALLVTLAAPVVEELFYRGLVLRALCSRLGARIAIMASSVVFAGSHFQPVQFPGLLAFALILSVITMRTGRLGPAVVAHAGFNAVAIVSLGLTR